MSKFIENGINFQEVCVVRCTSEKEVNLQLDAAERAFARSCSICCRTGRNCPCKGCPIKGAHAKAVIALLEMGDE